MGVATQTYSDFGSKLSVDLSVDPTQRVTLLYQAPLKPRQHLCLRQIAADENKL
jgi:hypothetical protein